MSPIAKRLPLLLGAVLLIALLSCEAPPRGNMAALSACPSLPVVRDPGALKLHTFANSLGVEFVLIPAGEFLMGADDAFPDEAPRHKVVISRPFYLARLELTQAQWRAVMADNPSKFKKGHEAFKPGWWNYTPQSERQGDDNPVENVSLDDAMECIRRLNALEGTDTYRLPTEAEWEYAAKAGHSDAVCFANDDRRWMGYPLPWHFSGIRGNTGIAGRLLPNPWGLYDMEGNVREWCSDWYAAGAYAAGPERDPAGPASGTRRVNRGGCWLDPMNLRIVERSCNAPTFKAPFLGLRLAKSIP